MSPLVTALLAATLLAAAVSTPALSSGLDAYLWKARPVLVFTPSRDAEPAAEQLKRLARGRAALAERDMPVFVVAPKAVESLSGDRAPSAPDAAALRKVYGVADDAFTVVLVGKDGGEKLRSGELVAVEALTGLVDAMPMRRREAR